MALQLALSICQVSAVSFDSQLTTDFHQTRHVPALSRPEKCGLNPPADSRIFGEFVQRGFQRKVLSPGMLILLGVLEWATLTWALILSQACTLTCTGRCRAHGAAEPVSRKQQLSIHGQAERRDQGQHIALTWISNIAWTWISRTSGAGLA